MKLYKVLVTGDRAGGMTNRIRRALRAEQEHAESINCTLLVIEGGALGVDTEAEQVCIQEGIHYARIPALWAKYNKAAGPIRNDVMVALAPQKGLAFHPNLVHSKGTKNCIERMKKSGVPVEIYG